MARGQHQEQPTDTNTKDTKGKLPLELQKLVDQDESFYDDVYSQYHVDSTETPYRYAAYATRVRTLLLSAHRYVAYTSDIGESFRPVVHPYLVRTAYGISWTYVLGDVIHEGYKAYLRNRRALAPPGEAYKDATSSGSGGLSQQSILMGMATGNVGGSISSSSTSADVDNENGNGKSWPTPKIPLMEDYRTVMAKRMVFQSLASMGLPAFTIHSVVKYSGRMLKDSKRAFVRTWAPIGLGLSIVPFLPYIFDEPVEEAVEWSFRKAIETYAGEDAVRSIPRPAKPADENVAVLSYALKAQESKGKESPAAAAAMSWDEYREQKKQEREQRKRDREEQGKNGVLGMLGLGPRRRDE